MEKHGPSVQLPSKMTREASQLPTVNTKVEPTAMDNGLYMAIVRAHWMIATTTMTFFSITGYAIVAVITIFLVQLSNRSVSSNAALVADVANNNNQELPNTTVATDAPAASSESDSSASEFSYAHAWIIIMTLVVGWHYSLISDTNRRKGRIEDAVLGVVSQLELLEAQIHNSYLRGQQAKTALNVVEDVKEDFHAGLLSTNVHEVMHLANTAVTALLTVCSVKSTSTGTGNKISSGTLTVSVKSLKESWHEYVNVAFIRTNQSNVIWAILVSLLVVALIAPFRVLSPFGMENPLHPAYFLFATIISFVVCALMVNVVKTSFGMGVHHKMFQDLVVTHFIHRNSDIVNHTTRYNNKNSTKKPFHERLYNKNTRPLIFE